MWGTEHAHICTCQLPDLAALDARSCVVSYVQVYPGGSAVCGSLPEGDVWTRLTGPRCCGGLAGIGGWGCQDWEGARSTRRQRGSDPRRFSSCIPKRPNEHSNSLRKLPVDVRALVAPCKEERFKFLEPHYKPLIDGNDLSQPYCTAMWEVPVHMRRVIAGGKQVLMFIRWFDVQVRRDLTVLFDGQLRVHVVDWSAKLHRVPLPLADQLSVRTGVLPSGSVLSSTSSSSR